MQLGCSSSLGVQSMMSVRSMRSETVRNEMTVTGRQSSLVNHGHRVSRLVSRIAIVVLLSSLVVTSQVSAGALTERVTQQTTGGGTSMTMGVGAAAQSQNWGRGCSAYSRVWVQEHRKSGVTRFKTRWELRGYYDTGILPTYGSKGWWRSSTFRDDYASRWLNFTLPYGYLNFSTGKQYSLWAKSVGERPSWWRPGITRRIRTGYVACENQGLTIIGGVG